MAGYVTSAQRRQLLRDNAKWPLELRPVPRAEWPPARPALLEVWRSRGFLVQVFREADGYERLTVCRTLPAGGRMADGITWDELQRLKRECGRGERDALELFPADADVVDVANMRHLWLPPEPVAWAWRAGRPAGVAK